MSCFRKGSSRCRLSFEVNLSGFCDINFLSGLDTDDFFFLSVFWAILASSEVFFFAVEAKWFFTFACSYKVRSGAASASDGLSLTLVFGVHVLQADVAEKWLTFVFIDLGSSLLSWYFE